MGAPVNRRLKIVLTDSYGRDLDAIYVADYPPGIANIDRVFIVAEPNK